ncbi:pigment biosynthesis protein yellowish-green 1 [Ophiostoma piceae UAMH 11346]|uniref:Pigment biosynthesis protein yellowish-green 1 n=1 Tax=Ophiostoma piceae (strain UAMH 11346) TaxID=1262450 RepID=S3CCM9_OPHP1|nr:pigment biosynthesis protein yellowish-green 1 [Ophiostoma piceae UAMH 11346]
MAGNEGAVASPAPKSWMMGTEAFEGRMPHHNGIKALWETKWKFPCTHSVYPFHDGKYEDFEPIFESLISNDINDGTSSAYTEAFFPIAEALTAKADKLLQEQPLDNKKEASELYLRACTVYRIARFPYISALPTISDETKWRAWEAQKTTYSKASKTWDVPIEEVLVPHIHGRKGEEPEGGSIPVYVRLPPTAHASSPVPVVVLLTGLDGYRPDNTVRSDEFLERGWASVILEIPGTADCPADPADPKSPERLWDSLFEWMSAFHGVFDMSRVVVWGLSAGGYYAVRIAHTHKNRLAGSVAQGAGTHYFFDPAWLARANGHEYPFQLTPALAIKYGYKTPEEYIDGSQAKFSLLTNGILDLPSTRLLLINGTLDGLMPIEDSMLLFDHGSPKEARFFPGRLHMGYPFANNSVYPWIESVMASVKL